MAATYRLGVRRRLRRYITEVPITRPFFDVTPESTLDAFREEAPWHPVFRIVGPAL